MKAKIEIDLDNDAFKQSPTELAFVLRNLALDIEYINGVNLGSFIGIADANGNTVGQLEVLAEIDDSGQRLVLGKGRRKIQEFTRLPADGDDNHLNE